MVIMSILMFLDWKRECYVHVDATSIYFGTMLTQLGEGDLDRRIVFASRKLSIVEKNYTRREREGLAMVHVLKMFRHYFLFYHIKIYTNHYTLRSMVNKLVLGRDICRWLFLFQEYDFEVVVKPRKMNARPDHLSRLEIGEELFNLYYNLPDAQLFKVKMVDNYFEDIVSLLKTCVAPQNYRPM